MKIVLKKLTSMVLVICMFMSLAAPALGEEPLSPPEETVYPDGTTVYADGTLVYADGTIVYADGTTVYADGITVDADGTTVYPDGTALYLDGRIVYADGTTAYPDGTTVYADGTVVYADGTIVYANGTTVYADGATVNADGTTVYPDGTTLYVDGTIVYTDGTTAYPSGTIVYPDGTTRNPDGTTVYPDGTTIYADGTTVNPDGTTVYPDGTAVNPDGTTVYANGTTLYPDGRTVYPDGTTLYADGSTVYPDGTTIYADGATVNPDGTTVYPDGTVVNPDGTTVNPDGTTVYADGTKLYPDGTMTYPDGTTVFADGTTLYADGTMVYSDGNADPLPEAEPVPAAEPEASVPDTGDEAGGESIGGEAKQEETAEETKEDTAGETTEETEEDTAEQTAEEAEKDNTEETEEETEEETKEETGEEIAEYTTEETLPPSEEFPLRTLTISADQMPFRDQYQNLREPLLWSVGIWNWLYGSVIEPEYSYDHVTVEISGHIPENVTARATFAEFADRSAAQNAERALMLLDVALLDENGAFYVPAEELHVSVSSGAVSAAASGGEPFVAYFDDGYDGLGEAGAVRVLLDEYIDGSRLVYAPEQGGRLTAGNGTVDFDEDRFPFRFVLSAQQAEVYTEEQAGQEAPAEDVMLSGTLVASDGYTYEVSVSYPADCGIPVGAELSVEELLLGTDAYWAYINQSAKELGVSPEDLSLARAFDISLVDPATGVRYQPTQDVQVSILLISTPVNTEEEISVLHFDDEAGEVQSMDVALNGEAIEFETNGFSVFVVLQRVIEKNLTAGDGYTYHITVDYDSTSGIPDGVELEVAEIREGDAGYNDYVARSAAELGENVENLGFARAFDISLVDPATGTYYQPNKNVKVSIQVLNENLSDYENVDVVHFGNDVEVMNASVNGEAVEFVTDGFSVYVITGSNEETITPQCTYTFFIPNQDAGGTYTEYIFTDDQGRVVSSQTIKNGDRLTVPQPPSSETEVFAGWYVGHPDGQGGITFEDSPYDFDHINITEPSVIHLYARYKEYAYVVFHDQYDRDSGTFPIAYSRRVELATDGGETPARVKISDLSTTYTGSDDTQMAFFGWSETPITNPGAETDDAGRPVSAVDADSDGCIPVTGTTHLYPIYKETHWLTYYTAQSGLSAAYVPPAQYFKGDPVDETPLPITSRDGYHFKGWYTGALVTHEGVETVNYGTQITDEEGYLVSSADDGGVYISAGKLYLRANATLFAKWEATYRIVYWKQLTTEKPETAEKHYEYAGTATRTANITNWGETIDVADDDKADNKYPGYTFNYSLSVTSAEINNTKDLTVFNLYYDLTEEYSAFEESYNLTFEDSVTGGGKADMPAAIGNLEYKTKLATYKPDTDPASGRTSDTGKKIYNFSGWYMDQACTIPVDWNVITMPDRDLTIYAGWEPIRFTVDIDPNYGALYTEENETGTGATFFNSSYDAEPIGEYTHVTRNYAESSSGNWYYVNHDRAYGGDRHTYYTQNPGLATEDTGFEYAPGTYTYVGWYEVYLDEDGNEIGEASQPYDFSQHVDHNTKLRLHWKKTGHYYLAYAAGDGTLENGGKELLLPDAYADYATVLLTKSATAPSGWTFVGWKIRGSDSDVVYAPGQNFTLHAGDAKRVSGKDVVYLDAVYVQVGTASIIYDANGGTVAGSDVNFGQVPGSTAEEWISAYGTIDEGRTTATVSGLANNTRFKLSNGTGFNAPNGSGAAFLGWSDKAVCDDSAVFYSKDSTDTYGVDTDEPITLYAVWGVQVNYNLNSTDAEWEPEWDTSVYNFDNETNSYSQIVNRGSSVSEPENIPIYNGSDGRLFRYWATKDGDQYTEYDFSQPVTGALDLYAFWSEPMLVKVHAVDASQPDLTETNWQTTDVTVGTVSVDLTAASHVTAPDDYAFAFAAVADSPDSVSDSHAVSAVKYDSAKKSICVKYDGDADFTVLERGQELYFVYYQQKTLNIGYKCMESGGALTTVPASDAPSLTSALGEYNMTESITQPLSWVDNSYTHYAFAIGSADAANASALSLVTDLSGTDTDRPALQLRNTWRGFEYSTDGNDWVNCGYNPALYVIYYTQQPTVIMLREQTVGTRSVMETAFTYDLLITESATTITSVQEQRLNDDQWENAGEPTVTTASGEPVVIVGPGKDGYQPYELKNGEADSVILFYSSTSGESTDDISDETRTVTTTTVITAQTAVITQIANADFATAIDGVMQNDEPYRYTCTADGTGGIRNVTFTNTHKSLPVEVHVVLAEQDGTDGIIRRDNLRSATYSFDLALGTTQKLLDRLPAADVFTGNDNYAFGAILYGAAVSNDGEAVTIDGTDAVSVAYEQSGETHEILLKDAEGNTIGELGSNAIYYLYYPMPRIRYVKANADGSLTNITGSHVNAGNVEESDDITYNHILLTMNGRKVEQNQSVEVPASGLTISQSGNNFRMPPILDDGLFERYLSYTSLGAGTNEASDMASISVSDGLNMQLRVQNNSLQYSFDGTEWTGLPLSGIPTIYAIYTERGYDLQISKTVDTGDSGAIPPFTDASFTVTISSMAITKDIYEAEGAEGPTVAAEPSDGVNPGSITLTVEDGTRIRIKKLGHGDYSIVEAGNENYNLTVKTGPILGSAVSDANVTDNTTVSITLDTEKRVDLTNSPKPLCKINDNGTDHIFYTLQSAVEYVEENIASYTATIEMLADYLVPAVDVPEIPNGFNITLTTAEEGFDGAGAVAVLTRTPELSAVPMMVNNGTLTLMNVVLEGAEIPARVPVIQSAGDLTIGLGTTIQNALSSGNGGAVNATAGNIAISGKITGNTAAAGGAIYHSGNGTITITGTGALQNNTASSGNGGAISLASGTISLSGTSVMIGNLAESGYGGAIYTGNAMIEVGQNSSITNNKAKSGGAIYADTATVSISETEGVTPPRITDNTATDGNGGAIHVGTGSVTVSGGRLSNNKAAAGLGGAIHTENASVTVSNTAEVKSNTATKGGAVYSASGTVTVSGAALESNTASVDGGAIYAGSGKVTVSGGSLSKNKAETGSGGALYSQTGNLELSGGVLEQNKSKENGGAVYAGFGSVTVSGEETELTQNSAAEGQGGAIYAGYGAVSITASPLTKNSAGSDGGAIYAGHGAVNLTDAVLGRSDNGNTAGKNGGAVCAGSGNVTVSGGSMSENSAADGNGGALYAGSGAITLSNTTLTGNKADAGTGGAVYLDSGSATLTTVTATDNHAVNGAAVFTKTGRTTFNDGSYTGNIATTGGAVGAGSKEARLYFNGNVQVKDNKLGNAEDAPKSNVYLDQDDDAVINIDTLGSNASIGIYVADNVENTRGVPGARFAVYTSNGNVNKITNDRFPVLTVQSDTAAKKLYWGNAIKVSVHQLSSYDESFTQPATGGVGTQLKKIDTYYPELNDAGISELASEVVNKNNINIGTTVYAGAYLDGSRTFGDYITRITWNSDVSEWIVTKRNGDTVSLKKTDGTGFHRIYIYYAEPAYISIENNTDMPLSISDMKVNNTSVINSSTVAGYGMVFAKNGAIRKALLPITEDDLKLEAGSSINLLIPGGRNMDYTLDGSFTTDTSVTVRLRRGAESSPSEETVDVAASGTFEQLTGKTLNTAGTYNIIFGDDKIICKVVDAGGTEHSYSKISNAIAEIKNGVITLATSNTATIEMVTDYLLPASDHVLIPRGYDITLTTALPEGTEGVTYPYRGESEDGRAVISRDSENKYSMIDAWNSAWNANTGTGTDNVKSLDNTVLRISKLVLDGKSVRGESDGGAVASKYVNVYVDNVDFKNVYASNGGAMLVMFSAKDKNNKETVPNTVLEVKNSSFIGCTSTTTEKSNRLGGGGIVTNAERMTLENCTFSNCTAVDQAGAAFHRVDSNYNSWATVTNCTFTNCSANAAGGLELNSKTITVTGCTFEHCVALERNGGGFNVWALNSGTPSANCWTTLTNCTFLDCQAYKQNGGGFRSASVYTTVNNCSFTNTSGALGGGIAISNTNAQKGEIYGCTFDRCTATSQGGGIYCVAPEFVIGDYTWTDGEGAEQTRHTEIKNCTSNNDGGGIYHDKNANNTSLTITNATISGNQTKNNDKNGGGVFTNCRAVTISGAAITDNVCTKQGGGVYAYSYTSLTITDSDISRNIASGNGGGVWFDANDDGNRAKQVLTIKGSTINGNSSNGSGGGIYTQAKTVTVGASETKTDSNGKLSPSSVSDNTAKNGGGIYQVRNVDGSKLEISNASINGNTASSGAGGGIYAGVRTLTANTTEISRNQATGNGGGIWYDGEETDRDKMALTVIAGTMDTNTSGGNGGGIYTLAKTVEIRAHAEGEGDDVTKTGTTISNCIAGYSGGGIYQNRDIEGSKLTVTDTIISGCRSNDSSTNNNPPRGGGGIFANTRTVTVISSAISNNNAVRNGGGIDAPLNGNDFALIIDDTEVTGNSAGKQGGGIFTRSQLTLRNGTEISGNRLSTNTVSDCAGVYLINDRTLFVGPKDAAEGDTDTIYVRDNVTANGAASDLRLWETSSENNSSSVYVYCNLAGEIYVVNAKKVGTWFGSSEYANPDGFSDTEPVFKADASTLHGIIDRNDETGKKIIWAGPPIAKITDGEGNLLYRKSGGNYPAIFDRLGTGDNKYSSVAAFNMLCTESPELYTKNGEPYTGTEYCIKMLDSFETSAHMNVMDVEGRTVTFTTAGKKDTDYPYVGSGTRATVTRGSGVAGGQTTLVANGNLNLKNIVLDGGAENGITPGSGTRCMYINNSSCTVTLGENALLQNGHLDGSHDGGGVYINSGELKLEGGVIRNCTARNGGGVYENGGTLTLSGGSNIYQCTATGNGGGVCQNNGAFAMSGGTVSNSRATQGGGVYVVNNRILNMSGGSITNNTAGSAGGGIAVGGNGARLNFSQKVNISGNRCDTSKAANKICNIELNLDSNKVINTKYGGLAAGSYIGVYVPDGDTLFDRHGDEKKPFGTFADGDKTGTFYSFVNDRNGLKGGIIENPDPNTIYWIQIFSLQVSKTVLSSSSSPAETSEQFKFTVTLRGKATATGQKNAWEIDSWEEGADYCDMWFTSNGTDKTTATFSLEDGQSVTGMNLSKGLDYEVIENLTTEQEKKYSVLPATVYSSKIGENSDRTDVDPYASVVEVTNILPICKITDHDGNLLYRKYTYSTGPESKTFYVPAVYTELTGDFVPAGTDASTLALPYGAFTALEKEIFYQNSGTTRYNVENGVHVEMLVPDFTLNVPVQLPSSVKGSVTLTTASENAVQFPFRTQDGRITSTITRGFKGPSMFTVGGNLVLTNIVLDGAKGEYIAEQDGGIINVGDGGTLTIREMATLQNSRSSAKGAAVFVASGGHAAMSGGTVRNNESDGAGAGIYLDYEAENRHATLMLSGSPDFGGKGLYPTGEINSKVGNFQEGSLVAKSNGGKLYTRARQDIYIAGYKNGLVTSLVVHGELTAEDGSIWIWAEHQEHYETLKQFAVLNTTSPVNLKAFRNARPDDETKNTTGDYLYGVLGENGHINWSGITGSRRVVLRKVVEKENAFESLEGAVFEVHRNSETGQIVIVDGQPLSGLDSGPSGVFWIGELPYGTYFIKETFPNVNGFVLTVDKDGVGYLSTVGEQKNYSNKIYAE